MRPVTGEPADNVTVLPAGPARILGRARERRLIDGLLAAVGRQGAALVLRGEPGVGKTALLDYAAATATGAHVLRLWGVESETTLPFAALADLVLPLRKHLTSVPEAQRSALEVCLALSEGCAAGPYPACAGTLSLLAAAGEARPLVVLVDDLQWIDPSSAQALLFVARRLVAERVAMILTVRADRADASARSGLPSVEVTGLDAELSAQLLREHGFDDIARHVLRDLVAWTAGNPLALLEAGALLSPARRAGVEPLTDLPPPSQHLEQAWSRRLAVLPDRAQDALSVVAASRSASVPVLAAALTAAGLDLADLSPAQEAGILRPDGDAVEFRHPLLRPVVLSRTPLATRLRTYRALAEVAPKDLRPWYLAAAISGPDEHIADSLADLAADAARRGGYGPAARAWRRAAELTPDEKTRAPRLLRAAENAYLGGMPSAPDWALDAARTAHAIGPLPALEADAALLRGRILTWTGHVDRAHRLLVHAAEQAARTDPGRAAALFAEAALPAVHDGRLDDALAHARRSHTLAAQTASPSARQPVLLAEICLLTGDIRQGRELLDAVHPRLAELDTARDRQTLVRAGQCRTWLEDDAQAATILTAVIDGARLRGDPVTLAQALLPRSELDTWSGQWAAAYADAAESLRWAEELGHANAACHGLVCLARIDAARGDRALCDDHISRLRRDIGPLSIAGIELFEAAVLGFEHLTHGEYELAVAHLERAWDLRRRFGLSHPSVAPFAADLAEAHIRSGNPDRAEAVAAWLAERADATDLSWPAAAAARCRGLLARGAADAETAFKQAKVAHLDRGAPFERARTLLCEGEVLRRFRRPSEARSALLAAHAAFERLGARPWAHRAAAELAAAGIKPNASAPLPSLDLLTPQELQIARSIAGGQSNTEAAGALYLSRKTVEAHLTRIYRKLNIRSRADLARIVTAARDLP